MTVFVKICGMTDAEAITAAVAAGADAVGFVFFERSPRNVSPARAAVLAAGVPFMLVFTTLKFCLPMLDKLGQPPLHLFDAGALLLGLVGFAAGLVDNVPVLYVVPALVWLLLTFRRGDLASLFGSECSVSGSDHSLPHGEAATR